MVLVLSVVSPRGRNTRSFVVGSPIYPFVFRNDRKAVIVDVYAPAGSVAKRVDLGPGPPARCCTSIVGVPTISTKSPGITASISAQVLRVPEKTVVLRSLVVFQQIVNALYVGANNPI